MGRVSAFSIAQRDIEEYFDKLESPILSIEALDKIFEENRKFWRLPESWHVYKFIEALEKTGKLATLSLDFKSRTFKSRFWKEISAFKVAMAISKKAHLSHYSALYLHELTDQIPKTIYVTIEQSPKEPTGSLTQEAIDKAFNKPQRVSGDYAPFGDQSFCLLHGGYTNNAGVIKMENGLKATNMERTLIDAAVRPLYCGGVFEVLEAYRRAAAGKVSINKLAAMLKKIEYVYPYHQAIGFYLERSGGYKEAQLKLLKQFKFEFDFYLTYDMKEREFSKEWRIYYPKGM